MNHRQKRLVLDEVCSFAGRGSFGVKSDLSPGSPHSKVHSRVVFPFCFSFKGMGVQTTFDVLLKCGFVATHDVF